MLDERDLGSQALVAASRDVARTAIDALKLRGNRNSTVMRMPARCGRSSWRQAVEGTDRGAARGGADREVPRAASRLHHGRVARDDHRVQLDRSRARGPRRQHRRAAVPGRAGGEQEAGGAHGRQLAAQHHRAPAGESGAGRGAGGGVPRPARGCSPRPERDLAAAAAERNEHAALHRAGRRRPMRRPRPA